MATFLPIINTESSEKKKKAIRNLIKKNRISFLTHFTRVENLKSILQFGILPASVLRKNPLFSSVIYPSRPLPPEWGSFVSLNVSFPDYKLFMQMQNHQLTEWVVLLVDSRILYEIPCYFFPDHAENFIFSAPFSEQYLNDFQSASDLKLLFSDWGEIKRKHLAIPPFYPTNPGSEILSGFPIAPSCILQVYFYSEYKFNQWVLSNTEFALKQDKNRWACGLQYFSPRSDYTFWKTQRPSGPDPVF